MNVQERLDRHLTRDPVVAPALFVAPNATVIGDVELGTRASVFYGAVLRGDIARIRVGACTTVQDNVVLDLADDRDALIGNWCTIGHGAHLHPVPVGADLPLGMGSQLPACRVYGVPR